MQSLRRVFVFAILLTTACDGGSDADDLDELLEEASYCSPGDLCVVVDTDCCPRAINVSYRETVEEAVERLGNPQECLADCISAAEVTAECTVPRCEIVFP